MYNPLTTGLSASYQHREINLIYLPPAWLYAECGGYLFVIQLVLLILLSDISLTQEKRASLIQFQGC